MGRDRSRLRATEFLSTLAARRSLWVGVAGLAVVTATLAPAGAGLLGGGVPTAAAALSCTDSWTGGAGTSDWNTAANWSAGIPDGTAVDACIGGGATVVSPDAAVSVGELVVPTGSALVVGAGGAANAALAVASGLENDGTLVVGPAGSGASALTVNGTFTNTGTLNVNGTVTLGTTAVSSLVNAGAIGIAPGGLIDVGSTSTLANGSGGALTFGIDGPPTVASDYGRIANGTFSLDGSAQAVFDGGFTPPDGSAYPVYAGNPRGTFATVPHGEADYAQPDVVGLVGGTAAATTSTRLTTGDATATAFGQSVQLTATVTPTGADPTGTVSFSAGGVPLGVAGLVTTAGVTSGSLETTALPVGPSSVTAHYTGDVASGASTSPSLTHAVEPDASAVVIATAPTVLIPGRQVTYTVTVSALAPGGGDPTGSVSLSDNGAPVAGCQGAALPSSAPSAITCSETYGSIGTHAVSASYSGDPEFLASTQTVGETVAQVATTTSVTTSAPASTYGQSVSFTATVTATAGVTPPAGSVTFKDGATILGTSVLSTAGGQTTTSMLLTTLPIGANAITATYDGTDVFLASSSAPASVAVTKAPTTLGLGSSANPTTVAQPVTFTATVFPGSGSGETGTVTFFDDGVPLGTGTVALGQATLTTAALAMGTTTITARYDGDGDFGASTAPPVAAQVVAGP